ncbi:polyketide synthase-like protein [Stachybotrys elegans]|uniref:Polyketide synthase-like protein n=1 Tax=Stachybotrys elegans TaxID=80388 RepID=A0A8K0SQI3_9HYPO|nr:polyketide synthase-like protein [Stachybotrys elegans]
MHPPPEDPICVVGMACRLPGDVRSPSDLWQFLMRKGTGQGTVPPERYNIAGFFSKKGDKSGVMNVDGGYFLREDVRQFDNDFFGINNFEATYGIYIDPQQRKLLEVIFECFENSGVSLDGISGSNTGVYVGNFTQDHFLMQVRDPDDIRRYHALGSGLTMLANRVSHVFNLHGPSLTLDTACSSSIYSMHLAVSALKAGECDGAVVAASNLILNPLPHVAAMKAGMLSPTSTCHTFDISADGYARAEGVNVVYLKRLSSAIENNDTIYGVIRGTAVNSAELQEAVVRKAYRNANLDFSDTDYIECHGTGTEVGDVVEMSALGKCFSVGSSKTIKIGGTKPNFGHSEAASSLTSLMKILLSFQHGIIPPTRGVETPSPRLGLDRHNMQVVTEAQPWPRKLQRASLSSFGYGGANAHAIIESLSSYMSHRSTQNLEPLDKPHHQPLVLPLSAASQESLKIRVSQIRQIAESCNTRDMESMSYTLGERYAGMGKKLLEHSAVFLDTIRGLDRGLQGLMPPYAPDWTLESILRRDGDESQIHNPAISQPVCTALQLGLVNMLYDWGVHPSAAVGHSSGEIASAYAAGLLSASQAIIVAYFRGYAVAHQPTARAMLACGIAAEEAEALIRHHRLEGRVCVACINAPESVTLSGEKGGIDEIKLHLLDRKVFCRLLETGGQAYHSPWMKDAGAMYEELLSLSLPNAPLDSRFAAKMYSTVHHSQDGPDLAHRSTSMPKYWRDNLENPVKFSTTLQHLIQGQRFHIIEIGPHSALKGPISQIRKSASFDERAIPYSPTLIRGGDAYHSMMRLAGRLFAYGHKLNWRAINLTGEEGRTLFRGMPPYPWDYSAGLAWFEPRASIELRNRSFIRHELLGSQQLAGNGIDWSWRNVLRPSEVPWLCDHRVESQVLFPAAGYLAMAMEAVTRVRAESATASLERAAFEFQNESELEQVPLEMHTTMTSRKLSTKTSSANIYDFTVSSCVRVFDASPEGTVSLRARWHEQYKEVGMSFGPHFQTLDGVQTDSNQIRPDVLCTSRIRPPMLPESANSYAMHPLTIDSCLQATLISAAAGNPDAFRAYVPVFIAECRIVTVSSRDKTGFSTLRADCSLLDAQSMPLVVEDNNNDDPSLQRHIAMRVGWKPDIMHLTRETLPQLEVYVAGFIQQRGLPSREDDGEFREMAGALLDLAGHKNPPMRVLETGATEESSKAEWLELLGHATAFPRLDSWFSAQLDSENGVAAADPDGRKFDVAVVHANSKLTGGTIKHHLPLMNDRAVVIFPQSESATTLLVAANFEVLDIGNCLSLAIRATSQMNQRQRIILIVQGDELSTCLQDFIAELTRRLHLTYGACDVVCKTLSELAAPVISEDVLCISLLEMERPVLATLNREDMELLHGLTSVTREIVWLIGANLFAVPNPDLCLVQGLSRVLMVEQPSLRFAVIDVGSPEVFSSGSDNVCYNIARVLDQQEYIDDKEYALSHGLLHVSRIEPNLEINAAFQHRSWKTSASMAQLKLSHANPARLSIDRMGTMDSMHFQQLCEPPAGPPTGFVDVETKAVSLNAKDVYTMRGRVETRTGTAAIEFSGVVTAIGPGEEDLRVGDRVVVLAPHSFSTTERVPAWTCHKLLPCEDGAVMATLPTIYSTALYAIRDMARLRRGESILVHSAAGAFGLATIALAQRVGAEVYTTVGSQAKREYLVSHCSVPSTHIFSSRDDGFVSALNAATGGRGVNVVVNSLVGDLMHATWRCLAPFGRFVEVGKRELVDAGKLEMDIVSRNTTFTAFDLTEMFFQDGDYHQNHLAGLVKDVLELYRLKEIQPVPVTTFDVSDVSSAYRYFSSKDRIGKIVISLEDPNSLLTVAPPRYLTVLSPDKVYILVGALGGLGRSVARRMKWRGAQKFVFLQRSGCDKSTAREFVTLLRQEGAAITVIKGDVANPDDVAASISASKELGGPIGGVLQAAMGLHEDLFGKMSSEAWHESVRPKWAGTWNLHAALDGHDEALDFFVMMSSMNGTIGIPTESNYCAANAFLDSFARWRRSNGKPAVSLALGMVSDVGYVHENPEIESLLLKRGTHPLTENDLLRLVDFSIGGTGSYCGPTPGTPAPAHILTGLEITSVRKLTSQGFEISNSTLDDHRMSILAAALKASRSAGSWAAESFVNDDAGVKGMARSILGRFKSQSGAASLRELLLEVLVKKISDMLLTPKNQIDPDRAFAQYGMDSMIASEFRSWLWNSFHYDIPFLNLLSFQDSLGTISVSLEEQLLLHS